MIYVRNFALINVVDCVFVDVCLFVLLIVFDMLFVDAAFKMSLFSVVKTRSPLESSF